MDKITGYKKIPHANKKTKAKILINSLEADVGDCCYFLTRYDKKIKFGTIMQTYPRESAVQVMESFDSKFHTVWEKNAAWEEKELKGQKWEKPHNYIRELPEENPNEEKSIKRISDVCNGKKKSTPRKRTKKTGGGVSKRTRRK